MMPDPHLLDQSEADYFAGPGVGSSTLRTLRETTPAHCQYELTHPRESDALDIGKAFHCLLLEPDRFADTYTDDTGINRRTKAGKDQLDELSFHGKTVLRAKDYDTVHEMARAVHAHPTARFFLDPANGPAESSLYWTDPKSGVLCRCRPDKIDHGHRCILDVKTTITANPRDWPRHAERYGYDAQAAMYSDGFEHVTGDRYPFIFLACEKTAPYLCTLIALDDAWMDAGRRKYEHSLRIYAQCVQEQHWPGYPADIQTIEQPAWARR